MEFGKELQKLELAQDKIISQSPVSPSVSGVLVTADTASLQELSLTGELEPLGHRSFWHEVITVCVLYLTS